MDVIAECRYWFGLLQKGDANNVKRKQTFMAKYVQSDNVLCQLFAHVECVTCGNLDIIFFLFIVCIFIVCC